MEATICSGSESGNIRPADGAANNEVAADQQLLLGKIIGHMPRGVTRGMHYDDLQRPQLQRLVVGYMHGCLERWNDKWKLKHPRLHIRMPSFWLIQRMEQNLGRRKPLLDDRMIGEVVEVAVRQPQTDHVPPSRGGLLEQGFDRVIRRVKKHRLPGCFIRYQEAISHCHPAGVR